MIGEDPAGEAGAATAAEGQPAPGGTRQDGAGDDRERERRRARQASNDARRAEREALELRDRLGKLTAELKNEQQRYRALRQRRATRLALALSDGFRRLTRSVTRRRAGDGRIRPSTAVRTNDTADSRSVPRLYRDRLLAALLDRPAGGAAAHG